MIPVVSSEVFRARLEALERWLWERGGQGLGISRFQPTPHRVAERVEALSDLYTTDRARLEGNAADPAHLAAKAFYFLPSDSPKVYFILKELTARYGVQPRDADRALRVVDAGAGVGATSVGLLLSLDAAQTPRVEITAIDADARALNVWKAVAAHAAEIAGIRLHARSLVQDLRQPDFGALPHHMDLFIAQALVNELGFQREPDPIAARAAWMARWIERGPSIFIEPALRETTRPLHAARDRLLATDPKPFRVLAPCPHQSNCPMLAAGERDWCHETRSFAPTPRVAEVQSLTRRRDERTKFSFVVFTRAEAAPPGVTFDDHSGRLVSDALNSKGKMERDLCSGAGGLVRLRLLDKDRTPDNTLLANAERGALIDLTGDFAPPRLSKQTVARPLTR